ncbi:hypothetical protein BD413DRAFT_268715 [Trametes elegans]|nr:hypothetical protein BD413DRAFT_268715 [Trametes elegans]
MVSPCLRHASCSVLTGHHARRRERPCGFRSLGRSTVPSGHSPSEEWSAWSCDIGAPRGGEASGLLPASRILCQLRATTCTSTVSCTVHAGHAGHARRGAHRSVGLLQHWFEGGSAACGNDRWNRLLRKQLRRRTREKRHIPAGRTYTRSCIAHIGGALVCHIPRRLMPVRAKICHCVLNAVRESTKGVRITCITRTLRGRLVSGSDAARISVVVRQ